MLNGENGVDALFGGIGNDTLIGGADNDVLLGEADHDSLFGQAGSDRIDGGAGNDRINGGALRDSLTGGAGGDRFEFTDALSNSTPDAIIDFVVADDTISIDSTLVSGIADGALGQLFFKNTAAGAVDGMTASSTTPPMGS